MRILSIVMLLAALCACGGGTTALAPPTAAVPSGTALSGEQTSVVIPASGGIAGSMIFPAVSAASTIQVTASTIAPPGVALEQARRQTQNLGTLAIYDYVTVMAQTTVTLPSLPAFTLTFPAAIATTGKSFFYAVSAPHASGMPSHFDAHGPAAISGQAVTFAAVDTSLTLTAGNAYTFIVYATYGVPADASGPRIYVANQNQERGTLALFNSDGSRGTPARIVTAGSIQAVAVDAAGKIYLANQIDTVDDTVTTFNPDGSPAAATIHGLHGPRGVAVDAAGKIYVVSNCCGNLASTLTTYDRNGVRTLPTISNGLTAAVAVAVDRNGKIYVLNTCCQFGDPTPLRITTYLADGTPTTPTIDLPQNVAAPVGLAVDTAGKIYVANSTFGANGTIVSTYSPNGSPTTPTIAGATDTSAIAVDAAGKIYVSSLTGPLVTYTPAGVPTVPSISVGVFAPSGIAVH